VSQQTIASLQAQMLRYAQPANGQNSQASADYKALQTAVQSGNVSDAQAALARLKRDSQAGNPASNAGSTPPATTSAVDGDGDQPWNAINVTA
jgi:predicted negative regulator of RcsB-dependent stress response